MKRIISTTVLTGALLALSALAGSLHAGVIDLDSKAGLLNSVSPFTVTITPHPLWELNPVNPGHPTDTSAVWISYGPTGYGDGVVPLPSTTLPVMSVFQPFTSGAGFLTLDVWADDTAEVFLDGISLMPPKFTQSICSGQPIGCQPSDVAHLSSPLNAGNHMLVFDVYQVGTDTESTKNPFGLLYTGTATATPEPGTLFLAGGVLITLGLVRKRRRAKS